MFDGEMLYQTPSGSPGAARVTKSMIVPPIAAKTIAQYAQRIRRPRFGTNFLIRRLCLLSFGIAADMAHDPSFWSTFGLTTIGSSDDGLEVGEIGALGPDEPPVTIPLVGGIFGPLPCHGFFVNT
jgi:hypothetical protein